MKHIWWSLRYFYYMNKKIRNFYHSLYLARVAHHEYDDWEFTCPVDAVDDELSCWSE